MCHAVDNFKANRRCWSEFTTCLASAHVLKVCVALPFILDCLIVLIVVVVVVDVVDDVVDVVDVVVVVVVAEELTK